MKQLLPFFSLCLLLSCATRRTTSGDDGRISVSFVQVNDVYEIAPLSGGREGGLARVATLKKEVQQKNPNSFLLMAGDFLSPSVYNSLPYEGKAIRGRQMIDAMNSAGFDLVCFGNHEFDIKEAELQARLDESRFQWIASNVLHQQNGSATAFTVRGNPIPKTTVLSVRDADGTTARIGVMAITLPFNKAPYVGYTDALSTAREQYALLKDSVDVVVALTHQLMDEDRQLADALPDLPLIMGGHEHDMRFEKRAKTTIAKAHANARSAYVIDLTIDKRKKQNKVATRLHYLNEAVALDSATHRVVQKWTAIADENFNNAGFQKTRVVMAQGEALDGRETPVRREPTNLTKLIVKSMEAAAPQAQLALVNAGSIRVDDYLPSPVTEYDIIRALPFGGGLREVEMKGSLLARVLDQGQKNRGIGGFLHYSEALTKEGEQWRLKGQAIDTAATYRVVTNEFLLTGGEANMGYLKPGNPDIVRWYEAPASVADDRWDIRLSLIRYLLKGR